MKRQLVIVGLTLAIPCLALAQPTTAPPAQAGPFQSDGHARAALSPC